MSIGSNNMFDTLADLEGKEEEHTSFEADEHSEQIEWTENQTWDAACLRDLHLENSTLSGDEEDQQQAEARHPFPKEAEAVNPPNTILPMTPIPHRLSAPSLEKHPTSHPPHSTKSGKPSHRRHRDQHLLPPPSSPISTPTSTPTSAAPTTTTSSPTTTPRELFVFSSRKSYTLARALFATAAEPNHPSSLRWCQVVSLLNSEPISCEIQYSGAGGVGATVVRPARRTVRTDYVSRAEGDGEGEGEGHHSQGKEGKEVHVEVEVERATVVLHRPHGGSKAWCERNVLENMAGALMAGFGWEKGDFIFREG